MANEVSTRMILEDLLHPDSHRKCYLPVMQADETIKMLRVHNMNDLNSLVPNKWGIHEPPLFYKNEESGVPVPTEEAFASGGIDLLIVPGCAFDKLGGRLGYGKGYYDKFLCQCHAHRDAGGKFPSTVSMIFHEQLVESIPLEPHDWKIDNILLADDDKTT